MPTSMTGVGLTAWVFAFGAIGDLTDRRLLIWLGFQSVVLALNLCVFYAHRRGAFADRHARARAFHRLGVFFAGLGWGLAGILWPLHAELGPGFALLFCYSGMCAGGATTLSGDPTAYGIFASMSLLPYLVQSVPDLWWVTVLLVSFVAITTTTVIWNERTLRESLALRFANVDLLDRALREHAATVAAHAEAERASRARTRFLAAASHDLRQPVQALSLFVDVLRRDPDLPLGQRVHAIDALGRTTDALRAMIEGLLDVSRLDAGVVVAHETAVPLVPMLDEIVAALRDEADASDVVVHHHGRPATVLADRVQLSRVLHNLAGNAVRHGGRGRVLLAIRHREDRVVVQVMDQGEGIGPEEHERIFEEFVQLGNSERDRRKGLGLGLPIVRRLCERNGWELRMRSNPGRGTTFSISLPVAATTTVEPEATRATLERPLRVLLVEDDALVVDASRVFLEAHGCTVLVSGSADEAIAQGMASQVDAIVSDLRLPGSTDGLGLIRRLRASRPELPAVLVTGDEVVRTTDSEGILVLRKPVGGDALWNAVVSVSERTEAPSTRAPRPLGNASAT